MSKIAILKSILWNFEKQIKKKKKLRKKRKEKNDGGLHFHSYNKTQGF